ncbi:MAG TPA: GMC family oxidoreductase [Candidatus Limnocylindria bacterium]|nr:GMC family oxidoreductase [Candidatus Limnocylindria bacterium]
MAAKQMPEVEYVLVGFGWTAGILANELTKAGHSVVALERGQFRDTNPDFTVPAMHDELAYAVRQKLFQDPARETVTLRNNVRQDALPVRNFIAFIPGNGVGGAGTHWNGATWRFLETDFQQRSHNLTRYGAAQIGEDCTSADWGLTYADLEPYYERFEYLCGTAGKAGNLNGTKVAGGNVFEGPRKREYPNPPTKTSYAGSLFRDAALNAGYHPFQMPASNSTSLYKNIEGVQMGECVYCGYCERFGCEMGAKASLQSTLWPVLKNRAGFELRTNAHVLRVELDSTKKKATGVTYLDPSGREVFQPAANVILCAFALNNVRLMLLSGIGTPYDPATGKGQIGRNYAYQALTGGTLFFDDKVFNTFMGSGALGTNIDDFNGDNFDHAGLDYIGGGTLSVGTYGARPIQFHPTPKGTPRWGGKWKAAVAKYYNRAFSIGTQGGVQAYRGNYLDLDPTYRDIHGQPLLRMTFDFGKHERKHSQFVSQKIAALAKALNAKDVTLSTLSHFTVGVYQTTHTTGGTILGKDPGTSAVDTYGRSWDVPNVFVTGANLFPQNAGYNPTGTVGALTYRLADALVNKKVTV